MIVAVSATQGPGSNSDPDLDQRFTFREAIENNRDHWGRPRIMLPDGSAEVGYRRASSYGAPLEDASQLERWKLRQVARGVARRGDLALAVTRAEVGLAGAGEVVRKAKRELNDLVEQAMEVVESSAKASIGTSLHHVFEEIDLGRDPGHIPEQWRPDVAAYGLLTEGFRVVSVERFVVQDEYQIAGTLDRAVELLRPTPVVDHGGNVVSVLSTGSVIIGDVKTSQNMDFAGCKFGVQCWAYATGVPYDPIKKHRVDWGHRPPRTDWAVIFHVGSGTGQAQLHWVNLIEAAEAADDARRVYEWRNKRGKSLISKGTMVEDFTTTCEVSESVFDLTMAYQRAVAAGAWNDVLKARFTRRRIELESQAVTQ